MARFAIAGIQMQVSAFEENITQMGRYLSHVRQRFPWVSMVLFSELAALGPSPAKAEPMPGEAESRLCEMAASNGLWLVPGSLFELRDGQIFNTSPVIDPAGNVIARFRKLFPFRPYEQGVAAGSEFVVFDVPGAGRIGISICYLPDRDPAERAACAARLMYSLTVGALRLVEGRSGIPDDFRPHFCVLPHQRPELIGRGADGCRALLQQLVANRLVLRDACDFR